MRTSKNGDNLMTTTGTNSPFSGLKVRQHRGGKIRVRKRNDYRAQTTGAAISYD